MNKKALIELYKKTSKHSQYQSLAAPIKKIIDNEIEFGNKKHDKERLSFILKKINFQNLNVVDIGGNTGYFSLELIYNHAKHIHFFEGNKTHCEFVESCAMIIDKSNKITVHPRYIDFNENLDDLESNMDVILLLNVLHHVGDDYGNPSISIHEAKNNILDSLLAISKKTKKLVFQMGFNWKGDTNMPLFENGTKAEMIKFISDGTAKNWNIEHIGVAELHKEKIIYNELNNDNIIRQNSLGEFLNRPIFIMTSKTLNKEKETS